MILDDTQHRRAAQLLPRIVAKAFSGYPKCPAEFHYGDLINKRDAYSVMPAAERYALANNVFDLILDVKPVLMATVLDKVLHKEKYEERAHLPHSVCARATLDRFNRHLTEVGQDANVVIDSAGFRHDSQIQATVARIRARGTRLSGPGSTMVPNSYLERIKSVEFHHSQDTAGIQLADAVAYATYSRFERGRGDRYKQLEPLWRRRKNGWREPSLIPHYFG